MRLFLKRYPALQLCVLFLAAMLDQVLSFATTSFSFRRPTSAQYIATIRDADFAEIMVGGERYEMIPLPDSMVSTTLFVGNLNEFVTDSILSDLFQSVSTLKSVPACVARKPNNNSMEYGFVTFPTIEEKEAAILRFHGYELHGRIIKVEAIRDLPNQNRVRVPGKMVAYACGNIKRTRDGQLNGLRRISHTSTKQKQRKTSSKGKRKQQKASYADGKSRLNTQERQEMDRAFRRGYLTLLGTGYRRGRKGSSLANAHRQWCDERTKPQVILCKASGGRRPLDNVIVDLSPLRISGLFENNELANDFLTRYKIQILAAAEQAGLEIREDYVEDNTQKLDPAQEEDEAQTEYTVSIDEEALTIEPIYRLPVISMGVFEGERAKAKAMARELALLWDIQEEPVGESSPKSSRRHVEKKKYNAKKGGRNKAKSLREHRRGRRSKEVWY